jgi:polyferredoxin
VERTPFSIQEHLKETVMCEHCLNGADPARNHFSRRDVLASATAAAAVAMMPSAGTAQNAPPSFAVGTQIPARGFGLRETGALLERVKYMHRAMRPDDVVTDVM